MNVCCSGGTVPGRHPVTWRHPTHSGSEESVRGHPSGSRGTRRCASYHSRARHRAPLQPRGRLRGGPDLGVFVGLQLRRLRPPGVKLRPPGTSVVPLEGPGLQPFTPGSTTTRPTLALPFWRPKPPTRLSGLAFGRGASVYSWLGSQSPTWWVGCRFFTPGSKSNSSQRLLPPLRQVCGAALIQSSARQHGRLHAQPEPAGPA